MPLLTRGLPHHVGCNLVSATSYTNMAKNWPEMSVRCWSVAFET